MSVSLIESYRNVLNQQNWELSSCQVDLPDLKQSKMSLDETASLYAICEKAKDRWNKTYDDLPFLEQLWGSKKTEMCSAQWKKWREREVFLEKKFYGFHVGGGASTNALYRARLQENWFTLESYTILDHSQASMSERSIELVDLGNKPLPKQERLSLQTSNKIKVPDQSWKKYYLHR